MANYEDLKKRVAKLKEVEKNEDKSRREKAAQEAAEISRAKAELLEREKENDSKVDSVKKQLDQANERSQRMRLHFEARGHGHLCVRVCCGVGWWVGHLNQPTISQRVWRQTRRADATPFTIS